MKIDNYSLNIMHTQRTFSALHIQSEEMCIFFRHYMKHQRNKFSSDVLVLFNL